jgi:small GTP-binding protein
MRQVKILVTGPYRAGKSSLINSMTKGNSFNIDRRGTTVCMDYGNVDVDGVKLHLFGTPGQERFAVVRQVLAEGMRILVMVVDSTKPDSITQARKILVELSPKNVPCIVAANKQDRPEAMSPAEVQKIMNLPKVYAVGTSAIAKNGTHELLSHLYRVAQKVEPSLPC